MGKGSCMDIVCRRQALFVMLSWFPPIFPYDKYQEQEREKDGRAHVALAARLRCTLTEGKKKKKKKKKIQISHTSAGEAVLKVSEWKSLL
jgi:hypothetical protein